MEISLAGWSIHRRFQDKDNPLLMLDYPKVAAEEFGIHIVRAAELQTDAIPRRALNRVAITLRPRIETRDSHRAEGQRVARRHVIQTMRRHGILPGPVIVAILDYQPQQPGDMVHTFADSGT